MCPEGEVMVGKAPDSALTRQALLERALALILGSSPAAALLAGCGGGPPADRGRGDGMGGRMPDWMMSRGRMDPRMRQHMRVIHRLLIEHQEISREVEEIPGGIRARTVSDRPEIAELIRTHVWQMRDRLEEGNPIRLMDPVFREIFEHHEAVEMDVEETRGGVVVVETSADPRVELLIRQHADRAVSEFVAEGMARAMRPTPLPPRYRQS